MATLDTSIAPFLPYYDSFSSSDFLISFQDKLPRRINNDVHGNAMITNPLEFKFSVKVLLKKKRKKYSFKFHCPSSIERQSKCPNPELFPGEGKTRGDVVCRVKAAVSHRRKWRHCVSLLAAFRPPMFRLPPCKSRCEFRRWLRLATVAGGRRTWTQPCFARLSRVPARTVSRDSWLEYIGAHLPPLRKISALLVERRWPKFRLSMFL